MEAATPLRKPNVRTIGDRLAIDALVVDDEVAVRLAREREEAGDDPAGTVTDALEIGARVLDREQAAANADFVRTEFERASRELEREFTERAGKVAELLGAKVDSVFSPENGQLTRELDKLFSDGSASSVQNRLRELLTQAMAKQREELVRQFSSADDRNPLADFKHGTIRELRRAHDAQQALLDRLTGLERHVEALRSEKQKLEELEEERERGTAKGRSFEDGVADAIDAIAAAQGDVAEAVGDLKGATGKTGDVLVRIDAGAGPAQGRIVFEAKNSRLSRPEARKELDRGMEERDADFGVLVVPSEDKVPARMRSLREYDGDKLVVTFDPHERPPLALEVGYRLARARVLMRRAARGGIDAASVQELVTRTVAALDDVRRVKSQLTGAETSIHNARGIVEDMAKQARAHLAEIDSLVRAATADGEPAGQTALDDLG
jgi:NACalpha-BTF3-like transcription factor